MTVVVKHATKELADAIARVVDLSPNATFKIKIKRNKHITCTLAEAASGKDLSDLVLDENGFTPELQKELDESIREFEEGYSNGTLKGYSSMEELKKSLEADG